MQILHINCNYCISTLHQKMIIALQKAGVNNNVFVPVSNLGKNNWEIEPIREAHVVKCFKKKDRLFFDYKQNKIYNAIKKEFVVKDFDCIHAHTLFTDGNCAMRLYKEFGIPYIVAVRNTDVNVFLKWMIHLRKRGLEILKNATAVVFLSEAYKQQVISLYVPEKYRNAIAEKAIVIPNGIDDFWINNAVTEICKAKEERCANRKPRVIYVGSIEKNKNLELTAKAINELNMNGWDIRYTAIGPVNNKRILNNLNSYSFFKHMDKKPKEDLICEYRNNDIFIMPSHTETFGLVYAEAMSQGLPVIYTKNQGFDGQFEDGIVGYSVIDTSAEDLVKVIRKTSDNYGIIANNAFSLVNKFSWGKICNDYCKIYEIIVGS